MGIGLVRSSLGWIRLREASYERSETRGIRASRFASEDEEEVVVEE
jgi:hypothetical protein